MSRMIKAGDAASVIRTTDLWGKQIRVPANGQWIYLSFHRFAACPFCNLRTNELIRHYARFEKHKVEVVSLWPSDKDSLLRHAGSEKPAFPMLSDKDRSIYKAYGVTGSSWMGGIRLLLHPRLIFNALKNKNRNIEVDADPKLMPASFLVYPGGIIRLAYYGKHFGDHPEIESILQLVK